MIVGNKWFYIIFSSLFMMLVIVNLALWMSTPGIGNEINGGIITGPNTTTGPTHYIGFKYFFNIISTYPGPGFTLDMLNDYCNVFTNFEVSGIAVIDWFIALFRLITGPIVISVTLVGDLITNLIWLFKWVFIDSWWNNFETHESIYNMPLN